MEQRADTGNVLVSLYYTSYSVPSEAEGAEAHTMQGCAAV